MKNIGFIGAGNMASAIIGGILSSNLYPSENINIFDVVQDKTDSLAALGLKGRKSIKDLAESSDIIFLSVKPQNFDAVLTELKESFSFEKIIVSIAAGISTQKIKSYFSDEAKVIRTMPNTPLMKGFGATAISHVAPVTDAEFDEVCRIFSAVGTVSVIPEIKMNEVVSVNGSSPAYIYLFAKAMIDSAIKQGIDGQTASELVIQSVLGSAYMLRDSGLSPDELIKMVSSPGGTTLEALKAFEACDFAAIVDKAMLACTERAKELSGE